MTERKRNRNIRRNERKADLTVNPEGVEDVIDRVSAREASSERFPLRVNSRTVIYVAKEKCTPEYAAAYLDRINRVDRRGVI